MRRAFTLIELLVVIAITALLMTVLFIPLTRSLELSSRGNAMVTSQDNVRAALRNVTRDLANAMQVYPPQDIQVWGYSAWAQNGRGKWQPAAGATPEPYLLRSGYIAFREPKQQYYDAANDHFVSQDDITTKFGPVNPDWVGISECPRHPGVPVELRPVSPLRPSNRIAIYFVALKSANADGFDVDGVTPVRVWRDGSGRPVYQNSLLFGADYLTANSGLLNTYVLYKAEFDPTNPADAVFAKLWQNGTITDGNATNPQPDPSFFYNTQSLTGPNPEDPSAANSITMPEWKWWASRAQQVMATDTADVVKWVDAGGKQVPHSLCTFSAAPIGDEVAQPNQSPGLYSLLGSIQPGTLAAPEYDLDNGHWVSIHTLGPGNNPGPAYDDSSTVIPDSMLLPNAMPANNPGLGLASPRIQVLERQASGLVPVFDSSLAQGGSNPRSRLVSYDSVSGKVLLSVTRKTLTPAGSDDPAEWPATLSNNPVNVSVDLTTDNQSDANGMPASFGAAATYGGGKLANTLMVVPGSEVIQLEDRTGATPERQPFHRSGFSINAGDPPVAPNDLGPYDYTINYKTGQIIFSTESLASWASALQANPNNVRLMIKYKFQTNQPTDVVRVSYTTRDMAVVNLGVVQYTRKLSEALPFEVAERVVIRNLKR